MSLTYDPAEISEVTSCKQNTRSNNCEVDANPITAYTRAG
jgi:hypothetical protein